MLLALATRRRERLGFWQSSVHEPRSILKAAQARGVTIAGCMVCGHFRFLICGMVNVPPSLDLDSLNIVHVPQTKKT